MIDKSKMHELYLKAYANTAKNYKHGTAVQKDSILKLVFYSVKAVNARPEDEYMTLDQAEHYMEFSIVALNAMELLTPRELLNIFPLEKNYDRAKYECKDYLYSINFIKEHGLDTPIGNGIDFLWEYHNNETRYFLVKTFSIMDKVRNLQGYNSMIVDVLENAGVPKLRKYKDSKGQDFFLNDDGNIIKPKKSYPRYLRLIKQ